jgi:type I restriction enzyme S subunit
MSELFELPEGWEWKKLRDTIEFSNKTVIIDNDDEYSCIGLEHIESNTGRLIDFKTSNGLDIKSSKVVFEKGMVLYGKLRPYLNKVWKAEFSGIATTEILPFKSFSSILDSNYLAHYLRSNYFVQNAMNNI